MKPNDFIDCMTPAARECQKCNNAIPASFTIAQAALESSWGESQLARLAHNLFGVKADASWHGKTIVLPTREFVKGRWVTVQAKWRVYDNLTDCVLDHAEFFKRNPRYNKALAEHRSGEEFAEMIAKAGYATDPAYAQKIAAVINSHNLEKYDL
jgi:flagellum-specific peptidoglycan hydrolase FlgJ